MEPHPDFSAASVCASHLSLTSYDVRINRINYVDWVNNAVTEFYWGFNVYFNLKCVEFVYVLKLEMPPKVNPSIFLSSATPWRHIRKYKYGSMQSCRGVSSLVFKRFVVRILAGTSTPLIEDFLRIFYGLFIDAVSICKYLIVVWLVNDELERIWEEAVMALCWNFPGGTEGNKENRKIFDVLIYFRTHK
jgi:hypothetical protein